MKYIASHIAGYHLYNQYYPLATYVVVTCMVNIYSYVATYNWKSIQFAVPVHQLAS